MTSTVYIAKTVYGGDGLGRLGDGRVVFVPGAWAGEQVKAEIVEEKSHFVKARLVEVVEKSEHRLETPEKSVPGMVYAGLSYEGELKAKEAQLREFLERARLVAPGDASVLLPGVGAKVPRNYRNKAVYHLARAGQGWAIGYRLEPSHEVVDVAEDPLARPEINAKLGEIRRAVTTLLTTGPVGVRRETERKGKVTVRWTRKTGVKWWLGDAPADLVLKETTAGLDFEVPAGGFYQVNPEMGEELVKAVVAEASGRGGELLDLYCGVGVFGLCCAKVAPNVPVVGEESGRQAIEFAKRNAVAQKAAGVRFFAAEVGKSLRKIRIGAETTVIVDPPRGGLERGVAKWLAQSGAQRIVYVSCDPATLTRDLREMASAYELEKVRLFDMFPRTARFETMAVLRPRVRG